MVLPWWLVGCSVQACMPACSFVSFDRTRVPDLVDKTQEQFFSLPSVATVIRKPNEVMMPREKRLWCKWQDLVGNTRHYQKQGWNVQVSQSRFKKVHNLHFLGKCFFYLGISLRGERGNEAQFQLATIASTIAAFMSALLVCLQEWLYNLLYWC